jgi:predicted phage terminase large subunit-like protein
VMLARTDPQTLNALLRQDLTSFIMKTFATLDGAQSFRPNWHIDLIADHLMRAYRREIKRLIITLPPRSLKSICASVAFPAWTLGRNPQLRLICASYSQDLSAKLARDCRTVMTTPWYRRAFPAASLNPDKLAETEFETLAGGYRLSTSVGGTLTGRGGNFIIIDDPIKPQDAQSEPRRQAVKQWYDSTLYSRLDNKKDDVIILIMQRVHVDDLVAHVQEKEDWEVLRLPAIAESDERHVLSDGRKVGRRSGTALHPSHEPLEVLDKIRRSMSSFLFSAQYQQAPVPAGGHLIKWSWFRTYEQLPDLSPYGQIVQSWDIAATLSDGSDWSVCTTWLLKDKAYYLIDVLRKRLEFPALRRAVLDQAHAYGAKIVLIEAAGVGIGLIQQIKAERKVHVIAVQPEGSKVDRMAAQSAIIEAGNVLVPRSAAWLDAFKTEMLSFPIGKHDDQVDSTSQMLTWGETRRFRRVMLF